MIIAKRRQTNEKAIGLLRERFIRDNKGNFAAITALIIGALTIVAVGAVDIARIISLKSSLQDATDAAALTAARELGMRGKNGKDVQKIIDSIAKSTLIGAAENEFTDRNTNVISTIEASGTTLSVAASVNVTIPPFLRYGFGVEKLNANASATFSGQPNVCVIGLETSGDSAVESSQTSRLIGKNCAVYANSKSQKSIKAIEKSFIGASFICSAGGYMGEDTNFGETPLTDCPQFRDPLKSRLEPDVGPCDHNGRYTIVKDETLEPGVYCGGITIAGNATANMKPGTYIMKDGPLQVVQNATLLGKQVGVFFIGTHSRLLFTKQTTIELEAPLTGRMAGILFFESRSGVQDMDHVISSNNARSLVGTIYLPVSALKIDAESPIADKSAYTAIVARRVQTFHSATVVLNTNYSDTNVPVPEGIGGNSSPLRLLK